MTQARNARRTALTLGTALALGTLMAPAAQAQEACSFYEVVRGDTLGRIASAAQVRGGYKRLYRANARVLASPHTMEVGQILSIPCADGTMPGTRKAAAARAPQAKPLRPVPAAAPVAAAPAPAAEGPITFLTGSGFAPFTDEGLPHGGAITQMITRSMELAAPGREVRVVFVNDWGAHLDDLLPTGAFAGGFPWSLPDCGKVDLLSEPNARRCTEFVHSDPFYQEGVSYYALAGGDYEGATDPADLMGATICRPDGWFSFDLEARGLSAPEVEIVWPGDQLDCWARMRAGEVDVVTYDTQVAEEDVRELGMGAEVVELQELVGKTTMHVFVHRSDPDAAANLALLNAGLAELRMSGEWFSIVREQVKATVMN